MFLMLLLCLGIYENIIEEHNEFFFQEVSKHSIHQTYKCIHCIFQPKRNHHKLIVSIPCSNCCFSSIFFSDSHLMIARPQFKLGEYHCSFQLIKNIILGKGYFFLTATLFTCLKSIHNLIIPSFFLKKITGTPKEEILGRMYPIFKNSSSYIWNSFSSGFLIL
jgi:hypothetical protein